MEIHCLNFISDNNPTALLDSGEDPETGEKGIPVIVIGMGLTRFLPDPRDLQDHRSDAEASWGNQVLLGDSVNQKVFGKRPGGKEHPGFPGEDFHLGFQKQAHLFSRSGVGIPDQTPTLAKKPNPDGLFGFPTEKASADGDDFSFQNPFLNILS